MKMIGVAILGVLLGLSVPWVMVRVARSHDATDWADEQSQVRQDAVNPVQPEAPTAAGPAAVPPTPPEAGPATAPALAVLPPPQPAPPQAGTEQPKTHTMTIYNGSQVTRVTF